MGAELGGGGTGRGGAPLGGAIDGLHPPPPAPFSTRMQVRETIVYNFTKGLKHALTKNNDSLILYANQPTRYSTLGS